ncbi:MAG: histone deacetylase [Brumimicrobium sp.]|nr:histone deacetylase [Brumimicrobium sp.]
MLKIAFHNAFIQPLPEGHRFPMIKYELLPQQLLLEGTIEQDNLFQPGLIAKKDVLAVHQEQYFDNLLQLKITPKEQRISGFPHDEKLIIREQLIMEGTRKCAEYALQYGISMNIAGGTHHAYTDHGEGFCLLNDQAIAIQWLLNQQLAKNVLVIDLDVHQGNGTAEIFQNTPEVFTFSMHGKNNYPLKKEVSDLDIPLVDGIKDKDYLYTLEKSLDQILTHFSPDFIFFQSGVDILETDKLGRLAVTQDGCKQRDHIVLNLAKELNVPIVVSMGGGYSKEIKHIVEAHANTYRLAQEIYF